MDPSSREMIDEAYVDHFNVLLARRKKADAYFANAIIPDAYKMKNLPSYRELTNEYADRFWNLWFNRDQVCLIRTKAEKEEEKSKGDAQEHDGDVGVDTEEKKYEKAEADVFLVFPEVPYEHIAGNGPQSVLVPVLEYEVRYIGNAPQLQIRLGVLESHMLVPPSMGGEGKICYSCANSTWYTGSDERVRCAICYPDPRRKKK